MVVWHEIGTGPFLAIDVDARACEEAVLGMLKDGNPRRGFGVLEPLRSVVLAYVVFHWLDEVDARHIGG